MKDHQNIWELYTSCKTTREQYTPLWRSISQFVGIGVDIDYSKVNSKTQPSRQLDEYVDDPTSAICVNQAGDYLIGIMWGTGDGVFSMEPSDYVLEIADAAEVSDYYKWSSKRALFHMNHPDGGLLTSFKPYAYDQISFGTSGIGAFPNRNFKNKVAENAIIFRNYGVDNIAIDEGNSGQVEYVFANYHWKINRIIGEFCSEDGAISEKLVDKMPKVLREAWKSKNFNQEFNIVFCFYPRSDYNPRLKGKKGTRYEGSWFLDNSSDHKPFHKEDFSERPAAIARMIKVRGEVYGRSSGTMLLSTIRSVNFIFSNVIEIIEKMNEPSLGMFSNAIFGDGVLDTSSKGLTIFNSMLTDGKPPTFPFYEVGNPAPLIEFVIPYLNEKIVTAFKNDVLLDFSSAKEMTATESLQRYVIRGKSLSGLLLQQKVELLEPLTKRCISILLNEGELGLNPDTQAEAAAKLKLKRPERVIPSAVLEVMNSGKPWYTLKWNNELEKLTRTQAVQNLLQILQAIVAIYQVYPLIIEAVDWYRLLKDINDNLDSNNKLLISEKDFKIKIENVAKQQQAAMAIQAGTAGAQIQKDSSVAKKNNMEANNVGSK